MELAKAVWGEGRDRAHALEIAQEALDNFDQAGDGYAEPRAEFAAWLAERAR